MFLPDNNMIAFIITATFSTVAMILFIVAIYVHSRHKLNKRKQEYLRALVRENEATMNAISMELHDHQTQMLNLARMTLHLLADDVTEQQQPLLRTIGDTIDKLTWDTQNISRMLHTDYVKQKGLIASLQEELEWLNSTAYGIRFQLSIDGIVYKMPGHSELMILRITQEAIHNVIKYAAATELQITLVFAEKSFSLTVSDNGKGFDEKSRLNSGLGTITMKERAAILKGTFRIQSSPGKGTTIQLSIPIPIEET